MGDTKYGIVEHVGVLSENARGWTKELNIMSWYGKDPKYDIREWSPGREEMGKGVTLSKEEMAEVVKLIQMGTVQP